MAFDPPLSLYELQSIFGVRYTRFAALSEGGQGVVFRAVSDDEKDVALKLYFDEDIEERSEREVAAMRLAMGDTLVALHGSGRCELRGKTCVWMATRYISGKPLAELLGAPLPPDTASLIGADIARAVEQLWTQRIVHRDIKPENIVISDAGRAVLIDLGVARHVSLASLTSTGRTWGTEGYLSPEQMKAQKALTCKSDIFAIGLVVQQCLLGRHPTGRRQLQLLRGGVATASLGSAIPEELSKFVDRMVAERPIMRPLPAEVVSVLSHIAGAS